MVLLFIHSAVDHLICNHFSRKVVLEKWFCSELIDFTGIYTYLTRKVGMSMSRYMYNLPNTFFHNFHLKTKNYLFTNNSVFDGMVHRDLWMGYGGYGYLYRWLRKNTLSIGTYWNTGPMYVCNGLPHCSKLKMNAKKLSRFQFHFPGLLGTSPMSKQETFFFSITGHQR